MEEDGNHFNEKVAVASCGDLGKCEKEENNTMNNKGESSSAESLSVGKRKLTDKSKREKGNGASASIGKEKQLGIMPGEKSEIHKVEKGKQSSASEMDYMKTLEWMESSSKETYEIYSRTKRKLYDLHNKPKTVNYSKRKEKVSDVSYVKKPAQALVLNVSGKTDELTNNGNDGGYKDGDEDDFDKQPRDQGDNLLQPTLLQLAGLAKSRDTPEPLTDDPLNLPPPPNCAPPPPPLPLSLQRSCSLPHGSLPTQRSSTPPVPPTPPPLPQSCRGILTKSPIVRPKLTTQSTSEEQQSPGPSNSENDSLYASDVTHDADLTVAREHLRIMIDNLRRFVPLASTYPDPDQMQLDELQTAIMDFRYLEQALLDPEDYLDFDDFGGFNFELPQFGEKNIEPTFARGIEIKTECNICYDEVKLHKRICCDFPACDPCIEQYIETNVEQGVVKIPCLGSSCDAFLFREEILGRLSVPMKDKYYKFLVDANKDPKVKTCPRCSNILKISDEDSQQKTKYGLLVTCPECRLEWCFECQAPWHKNIKCKEFRKGDKLVKSWAKEKHYGTTNAQKCPKCKIFIERKGGCDHMICSKCDTGFCYKCGGRYLDLKFFGNHLSRYSPLGCKYNYKPDRPVLRRLIRGSVFGAKLLGGVFLVGLGVAAVGVLLGASVVILPAFGAYKYRRHRKFKRRLKRQQELIKMRSKNAMMELHRERPYMLDPRTLRERESLWETLVREEAMRRSTRSAGNDTVHIGIQTGQSQQVDVTVHNPYQPDALVASEDTQNSEIRMNITDERGHVTVTTAEISHNSSAGDGSEAEIVLHVKTSYPKNEKETRNQTGEKNETTVNTDTDVEKPDVTKLDLETKVDVNDSSNFSKFSSPQNLENRPKSAQVHRRAHSTGSVRKNLKKQDFGSISRKWRLKSLSGRKVSETDSPEPAAPCSQDLSESLNISEKASTDVDENSEAENLNQSGCFLKLLGKKLNNYQNQIEKEKQQLSSKSDSNLGDRSTCPDVVSCALEAELKSKENLENVGQNNGVKVIEKDAYMGLVSTETDTTAL
ncbi:uncharacterized protein LOC123540640 isoform X2 [Mercenaria mercenaria]|uniref:uncharacterized protein LOC123540640 isoform X2 n=1 Tax=Mercenaria mercenaria TaxID=6596 RepID=UPI00234F701D|nr:uncharacterized protein LOC123540640 isoform X2 [Mercenaria mercenaria]